jgi:DNA replication protein DnaC
MYYNRSIPKKYAGASFDNFRVNDGNRTAYNDALNFRDSGRGLFIHGKRGCGKTHLACAIGNKYSGAIFVTSLDFVLEIKEGFTKNWSTNEIVEDYSSGLLIFDDLGSELQRGKDNGFAVEAVSALIDRRYREDYWRMIITSNYSIGEISDLVNDRIASRIVEMCVVVENKDIDQRISQGG